MEENYRIVFSDHLELIIDKTVIITNEQLVKLFSKSNYINLDENFDYESFKIVIKYIQNVNSFNINKLFETANINIIFKILYIANYLKIDSLINLIKEKFINIINNNSAPQIREIFNLSSDN